MMDSWRRHRFALALLALLVAIVFARPLAEREVFKFRDHSDYFQPLRYYTAIHIRSFLLPYWNPYSASGEPWLANPQTGVFYPPTWLFIALPFDTAYMLYLALHLMILGWGAYLLFSRKLSPGAALVGAAIVTFCGPTMSLLDVSNNLASFAWVPLVLWCGVSRASPRVAGLVLTMTFLAGEPFFAAIAAILYVIAALLEDRRSRLSGQAGLPVLQRIVLSAIIAFGLSAIQLLPFMEMLRGSDRAARLAPEQIFRESMALRDWLRIVIPPKFSASALDPSLSQHFIAVIYIGIPAVLLAIIAVGLGVRRLACAFRRRRQAAAVQGASRDCSGVWTLAWLALLAFAVIIAAGNRLPLIGNAVAQLPLTLFRYPARLVPFGALAIAALAAMGWDRVRPDRRWADLLLVLIIVADLLPRERPLFQTNPFSMNIVPYVISIGRQSKIIRMPHKPITNRSAWIAGYLNLYQRRYDAATAAPVVSDRYLRLHDSVLTGGRGDLFDLIGAGFILADEAVPGLQVVASSGPVTVYFNPSVPPMATFWTRAESFASPEDALRATLGKRQPGTLCISPPVGAQFVDAQPLVMSTAFVSLDTRQAHTVIDAPRDGIVMLTQQDSPAWRVYVDGVEKRKLLAAGNFRAVAVTKGKHDVQWRYHSSALAFGMAMTAITSALLLLSKFVKRIAEKNVLDHA
jgi:hypothetical protein